MENNLLADAVRSAMRALIPGSYRSYFGRAEQRDGDIGYVAAWGGGVVVALAMMIIGGSEGLTAPQKKPGGGDKCTDRYFACIARCTKRAEDNTGTSARDWNANSAGSQQAAACDKRTCTPQFKICIQNEKATQAPGNIQQLPDLQPN
jgi:hypothetical protein